MYKAFEYSVANASSEYKGIETNKIHHVHSTT